MTLAAAVTRFGFCSLDVDLFAVDGVLAGGNDFVLNKNIQRLFKDQESKSRIFTDIGGLNHNADVA